ncbi:S-layer homology domain-containing protein, partial [Candidatus Gracilibacteria bacterium]|nr:S-layer homology domain-containing protein [Candidatus Gracilibacteria bacterium]
MPLFHSLEFFNLKMKILSRIIFTAFLFIFIAAGSQAFANNARVQDVFVDIDSNYPYLQELQQLYDRGMIVVDNTRRFNPNSLLDRDEFVGITMEVICEKCIQPQTQISFLQKYANSQAYFDVDKTNPYFYCIEEADDKDYVRGYGIGVTCENGTSQEGERPFCPDNRILLEEAIAVLLRNSGIFTIEDNERVTSDIRAGIITDNLAPDVIPTDINGNAYTFYGYLRKALDFQITEFDTAGNPQVLNLLNPDSNGNINPKKFITREEFLKMAYVIFKSNSCVDIDDAGFALAIDIWEKECSPGDINCTRSSLDDPENTYDFTPDVEGFCDDGIVDPDGYFWRFYNTTNGQEFFRYGTYLDDLVLPSEGVWRVFLRVTDRCGNSSQVYSTIVSGDPNTPTQDDTQIDVSIIIYDGGCPGPQANCEQIDFYEDGESG